MLHSSGGVCDLCEKFVCRAGLGGRTGYDLHRTAYSSASDHIRDTSKPHTPHRKAPSNEAAPGNIVWRCACDGDLIPLHLQQEKKIFRDEDPSSTKV